MVTSNKQPDQKVVKMDEQNNVAVVPQRTLIGEVNEHITCPLCRGYYIDATTIVECLHSFCRSCIIKHLQVKSYCPVCEMMINSAKPNIKLDKALQDIVYKLVPGLFQKEMERRQQFYSSRPGPAASATPEQRGEDTERIIFSPEDVISFSLEYSDLTDADSISSKSSDSNEPQSITAVTRRYLQCPAVVNINHLKKFLSMKFDIDSTQFAIDILYKRVPLPDYYTLMDIAYIYNWKRNEPMRFFYQIIDYVAIRNRLFDVNRKGSHFPDRKSSPTGTEDTNVSSPAPNLNDQGSELSSGTDSPMPDESSNKMTGDTMKKSNILLQKDSSGESSVGQCSTDKARCASPLKKNDDEVEKSQFLNSFELTAKNISTKSTESKPNNEDILPTKENSQNNLLEKNEDSLKRKLEATKILPEIKKVKIELEKAKIPTSQNSSLGIGTSKSNLSEKLTKTEVTNNTKAVESLTKPSISNQNSNATAAMQSKDIKPTVMLSTKQQMQDNVGQKRNVSTVQTSLSPKRKPTEVAASQTSATQKLVSPLKLQIPKSEPQTPKQVESLRPIVKKIPDLKSSLPPTSAQNKGQSPGKLRMDLLSNNCDPTSDRSKIMSQVKTALPVQNTPPTSGDPLKSLFDSCKINIPSSLSITLTDQKLDVRSPGEQAHSDTKKNIVNKNLSTASNIAQHKAPSPPVHNYIEILKLPDTEPKKQIKTEGNDNAIAINKTDSNNTQTKQMKSPETSAKGPVPNLKPIADTKLGKQSGSFSGPITFQQTFEQQLLQADKKPKLPKTKSQVPKLVPATSKSFAASKLNNPNTNKMPSGTATTEGKASVALDLTTPHNIQSQLGPQQTKAFETMQSIANLAKKQGIQSKSLPQAMAQANNFTSITNRPLGPNVTPLRVPSSNTLSQLVNQLPNVAQPNLKQEVTQKSNLVKQTSNANPTITSPNFQSASHSSSTSTQPSPRPQTRSPSSSPKLVIAEEKQSSSVSDHNINQSNQITSTQISNISASKIDSLKVSPGPNKSLLKPLRPLLPIGKMTSIRQPITSNINSNTSMSSPSEYLSQPQLLAHAQYGILRHQMANAWYKAQREYDMFQNMSNMAQSQNDFNNKEKQ